MDGGDFRTQYISLHLVPACTDKIVFYGSAEGCSKLDCNIDNLCSIYQNMGITV